MSFWYVQGMDTKGQNSKEQVSIPNISGKKEPWMAKIALLGLGSCNLCTKMGKFEVGLSGLSLIFTKISLKRKKWFLRWNIVWHEVVHKGFNIRNYLDQ